MINDVTYELIKIVKKIELNNTLFDNTVEENITKIVNEDIENIIKEMVEIDNQFRFKKGIFERQYSHTVEYTRCGEVVIKPMERYGLVTIMDVNEFLEVLSFRIYKGIKKTEEEHENWKLWKMSKVDLENMGVM